MVAIFRKIRKKKKANHNISLIFGITTVLLLIGWLTISNFKIFQKRSDHYSQIEALKKEIRILEEINWQLEEGISESIHHDYIESVARERFNLKKPGEEVITVLPPEQKKDEQTEKVKEGFWSRFFSGLNIQR